MSDFTRPNPVDAQIDAAMKVAASPEVRVAEAPLKRQWDDDLEKELEAVLEGFDETSFDVNLPRTRGAAKALGKQANRGQETRKGPQVGEVIAIRGKSVFIDLGAKSEGVLPLEQFGDTPPEIGAMIEVVPDRFDAAEGLLLLALKGAAVEADWENLRKGLIVEAKVIKTNKGGLDVEVNGIRGFLPIGQIDYNRVEDASVYVNQKLRVIVTEANQREKNLVVSRRDLVERERAEMCEKTWAELEEGQTRKGVVRSVRDFGAFVDLGGVDGLLHISDKSWARLTDAGRAVTVGQEVEVKVLKIDREAKRVSLGLKQLTPSPWDLVDSKYSRGDTVSGKVTRLMEFGAFVELEPGIEGLIHITELGAGRIRKASEAVTPGQEVEVRILKVESEIKRISLSIKPLPVAAVAAPELEDEEEDEESNTPKPIRKVPLKGGGGGGGNLFGPPKA